MGRKIRITKEAQDEFRKLDNGFYGDEIFTDIFRSFV